MNYIIKLLICFFIYIPSFSSYALQNFSDAIMIGHKGKIKNECNGYSFSKNGVIRFVLDKKSSHKRCEIAIKNILKKNTPFYIEYVFKVKERYQHTNRWHSLFQIHAMPDKGENWRCPIMALETYHGQLRMFKRWDYSKISSTNLSTCSSRFNTMKSQKLFEHVNYWVDKWNKFEMFGTLGMGNNCIYIKLNNVLLSKSCGANMYNDKKPPYFKFGIYKPTGWSKYSKVELEVKQIQVY